jgi:hypothetical protein
VFLATTTQQYVQIGTEFDKRGFTIPAIGLNGGASPDVLKALPASFLANFEAMSTILPITADTPATKDMQQALQGTPQFDQAREPMYQLGWADGVIVTQAIERAAQDNAGAVTRATVLKALAGTFTMNGLTCDIDWSAHQVNPCVLPLAWNAATSSMDAVGTFADYASDYSKLYIK